MARCRAAARPFASQWIGIGIFMAWVIVASRVDAQTRNRVANLDREDRRRPCHPLWAVTLVGATLSAGPGNDVELIQKLGEFQMTRGVIAEYHVDAETRSLDIKINPTTPLPTGEAGAAGRKTCALGTEDLADKLTHAWTVRVFISPQAVQAFACKIDAARPSLGPPPSPRTPATASRDRFRPRLTKRQR
jgi:hypothetical protein